MPVILALLLAGAIHGPHMVSHVRRVPKSAVVSPSFRYIPGVGAYPTPITPGRGSLITDARATGAFYSNTASTITLASANQLRVGFNGVLMEPGVTNYAIGSEFQGIGPTCGGWTQVSGAVCLQDQGVGPDGATTLALLTSASLTYADVYRQKAGYGSTPGPFTAAMAIKAGNQAIGHIGLEVCGSFASCTCATNDGTACTPSTVDSDTCVANLTTVGSNTTILSVTALCNGNSPYLYYMAGPGTYKSAGVGSSILVGEFDLWIGRKYATSHIQTTTTAVARASETAAIAAVGYIGGTQGSGVTLVNPLFGSLFAGENETLLSTTGLSVSWVDASQKWSFTAGGATALSVAQTFGPYSLQTLHWRYGSGNACLTVNSDAEVCTAGFTPFTPTDPVYLWGSSSEGGGWAVSTTLLCPGNSVCL